jgi:hypothetical protein
MLEVMHPDFPRNNLFRHKTTKGSIMLQPMHFYLTKYSFDQMGLATIFMGVCQSFQTQENRRKHHAPAHAFLLNQIFLRSNGPGNHFHGSFDTVILSLEILKLSPQKIISKNKNFVKEN